MVSSVDAAPTVRVGKLVAKAVAPTDAYCRANYGSPCFSPQEIRTAYGLTGLIRAGYSGRGQTIVLIESYGSPTLLADLQAFDSAYGLPDPPSLKVLAPLGTVPFDPTTYPDQIGWAFETSLDVQWAHALAPEANIVVLTSPVDETEGVQGLPEFLALETYALEHQLGQIISQSWAATENSLFTPAGKQIVAQFNDFYETTAARHVTVLASTGDAGTANVGVDLSTIFPYPTVNFPASSPLVTAVGGTTLVADTSGKYQYESVWDTPDCCAGGGGVSQIFGTPDYQRFTLNARSQALLAGHRGIPDVSFNADDNASAVLVYASFLGPGTEGFYGIGGTSEGSPAWAGVVADLNQYAGRPLGFLNPALYALGAGPLYSDVFHDVTIGNNALFGIAGYSATTGWDPATGWGTPNLVHLPLNWLRDAIVGD